MMRCDARAPGLYRDEECEKTGADIATARSARFKGEDAEVG
jgi:hypothetical protein